MYAVLNSWLNCSHIKHDALSILLKWFKFPKRWQIVNKRVLTFRLSDNVKFSPWYHNPANNLVAGQSVINFLSSLIFTQTCVYHAYMTVHWHVQAPSPNEVMSVQTLTPTGQWNDRLYPISIAPSDMLY